MHLEPESQVTTFVELMRSSDKVSKEWKVLIKYKEQPVMLSLNCYTGTFLWSSLVHPVRLLLPSWSPKPWAPFSSVRVCVCLLPCWFLRCWQLQCIITGKCNAVDPLHLFFFFQTLYSDCAQAAVLPEEMQSEASLHVEGALVRYFASTEMVKYKKPKEWVAVCVCPWVLVLVLQG